MLFLNTWRIIDSSEHGAKRALQVFSGWSPPPGMEIKGFYTFADLSGGASIAEVDSAATMLKVTAVFTPWLEIQSRAIVPIEEGSALQAEAVAFRDSIS